MIREFIRRAELSATLDHAAIPTVLDAGDAGGRVFYATPPADALPLGELVRRDGPLSPGDAIALFSSLADGLDVAHAAGLTHGAISPTTIWVRRSSSDAARATLTGFGVDVLLRTLVRGDQRDQLLDDALYIAPEQLRGDGGGDDGRADQYALACALHHCVTGRPPFVRDRTSALFGAHLLAGPATVITNDSQFDEAIVRAMAKDPGERFDSCIALLESAGGGPIALPPAIRRHRAPALAIPRPTNPRTAPHDGGTVRGPDDSDADAMPSAADHPPASAAHRPGEPTDHPTLVTSESGVQRPRRRSARVAWLGIALLLAVVVAGGTMLISVLAARTPSDAPGEAPEQAVSGAVSTTAAQLPDRTAGAIAWKRDIGDEPVTHLDVNGANAIATTGNDLTVVNPLTGSRGWRKVADVGILTDLVAFGEVVVYRTSVLSAVSFPYGIQLWENKADQAPTGGLTAGASGIHAIGRRACSRAGDRPSSDRRRALALRR